MQALLLLAMISVLMTGALGAPHARLAWRLGGFVVNRYE
jgi:hypothetical protein